MTEKEEPEIIIMTELPERCDGCGAKQFMEPVSQVRESAIGKTSMVIGYFCVACQGQFLYRN